MKTRPRNLSKLRSEANLGDARPGSARAYRRAVRQHTRRTLKAASQLHRAER